MTNFLTLNHVGDICFALAQELLAFDEPIPAFETRYPKKLEGILGIPQQGTKAGLIYKSVYQQAAVLFYSLVKEHPFLNGNKRLAVVCLLVFLQLNKHWLKTDWKTLYGLTVFVANSDPIDRSNVLKTLEQFIKETLVKP
jgi:death-on-curing protein